MSETKKENFGGTRLTEGAAVSGVVPADTASHAVRTPGSWMVHPHFRDVVIPASDAGKKIGGCVDPDEAAAEYCKIICWQQGTEYPQFWRSRVIKGEAEANASLIAAAPDLYAALKEANNELVLRRDSPLRAQILAALAKADGHPE